MYQRIWTPHVGEKAITVRESGNKHNQFAVALLEDEMLCTVSSESLFFFVVILELSLFVRFVGGSVLDFQDIGNGASFGSLLK